jgi:DNA-binding Lrp family transcriptional regulator
LSEQGRETFKASHRVAPSEEMDDTDRELLVLISQNPRMHFRELAKRLEISRQAVHRRVQALTECGVMKPSIAMVSFSFLDAVSVAVWGFSKTTSMEKTLDRLGEGDRTRRVVVAGGNYLYVIGFLRNISELDNYVEFVRRTAEIPETVVGIYNVENDDLMPYSVDGSRSQKHGDIDLSALDFKIIGSLRDDARRPMAEIAKMVGVSTKTVRRHLENLTSRGALDMSVPMDMTLGGDLFMVMHVNLKYGADKRDVGRRLLSKHYFKDQYIRTHSNLPSLLAWVLWSDKISEVRRALKETSEDKDVTSVMINFAYMERIYKTWRDRLPEFEAQARRKPGSIGPQSRRKKS